MPNRLTRWRRWLVLPPLLLGGAVAALLVLTRDPPVRRDATEERRTLRVIQLAPTDVVPRAIGHGSSRPARVWRAVAEVSGRVIASHDELRAGAVIREGSELLRIDPTEYELSIAQLTADLAQIDAQISELDGTTQNLQASLKIEEDSLRLAETDLERMRGALEGGGANRAEVDAGERTMLAQRKLVQDLRNTINLLPAKRLAAEAGRAVKDAQREIARLNLSRTIIVAPFGCRVGAVDIQLGQYLQTNETLFEAFGIDRTEVEAQMRLGAMRNLVRETVRSEIDAQGFDLERLRDLLDVDAEVRVEIGAVTGRWEATFDRIRETIDPQTRTVGVVVVVDRPYDKIVPGERPPLIEGAYCEVELRGRLQRGRLVVPRESIRDGAVYVVNADSRLERRHVVTGLVQSGIVCIKSGLAAGDLVVVSDPVPAIDGMLVEAIQDDELLALLTADAIGEDGQE